MAALLGLTLLASAHGQTHVFKDWAIACDNTRHCEAMGYQSDESGSGPVVLWMSRDAGPDAPVSIQLDTDDNDNPRPLTLRLGKTTLRGVVRGQALDTGPTQQLLAHLLGGGEIVVSEGANRWQLSLAGSNAALLKMDDLQGRVGTPGALVRKGKKPENTALPALPAPQVRRVAMPRTLDADYDLLKPILKSIKPRGCWDDLPDEGNPEVSLTRVSPTQVLVLRECGRGAYQSGSGLWLANGKPPYAAQRLVLPMPSGETTDYVMNASVDDGRLTSYTKGRGVNDCGATTEWAWNGKGFSLIDASQAPLCKGLPGGGFSLRTWTASVSP